MEFLHQEGIYISPYIDDLLIKDPMRLSLVLALTRCINVLVSAGFVVNIKKSVLCPTQDLVFVGGHFRTDQGVVTLPEDRYPPLQSVISRFHPGLYIEARVFQQLLGLMASMLEVVPWARFHMRPIQDASRAGWGGFIPGHATQGLWTVQDQSLHIKVLEFKAIFLALQAFEDWLSGKVVFC